jgi:hypothetical protein
MAALAESILKEASERTEGSPLLAKEFLHIGSRAAIDQALSRLARQGRLMRASRGVYVRPIGTRFGLRPPSVPKVVEALAQVKGEHVAPHGAAAANMLGVTTQVPVRTVYLTSGRKRRLRLGAQEIELRHAPAWQLVLPNHTAGHVIRTLAWLGPQQGHAQLSALRQKLSPSDLRELTTACAQLPGWMAQQIGAFVNA